MRKPRTILAALALFSFTAWSLPLQPGHNAADAGRADYSALDPAQFEIRALQNTLHMTGHTTSERHEQRLRRTAAEHFPGLSLTRRYRALGMAPDWWDDATVELLEVLATMQSASAVLKHDRLRIRAIVADKAAARSRINEVTAALPAAASVDIQLTEVDARVSATTLCERQFGALHHGPVGFAESGTEMRTSAYPVLDRIVALADACRKSTISITGHTDASGDESWNRQLSLARAQVVAEHLAERGIDADRLIVAGVGSAQPVADNATRYGRSINRRIEIRLEPAE